MMSETDSKRDTQAMDQAKGVSIGSNAQLRQLYHHEEQLYSTLSNNISKVRIKSDNPTIAAPEAYAKLVYKHMLTTIPRGLSNEERLAHALPKQMSQMSREVRYALATCENERLELALQIKNCGNRHFKENWPEKALELYRKAWEFVIMSSESAPLPPNRARFDYCGGDMLMQLPTEELDRLLSTDEAASLALNLAATLLQLELPGEVSACASFVMFRLNQK